MTQTDFTTTFLVDQTPQEVFTAISNVGAWWQGEINGSSNNVNDEFTYRIEDFHFSKQKVVDLIPYKLIVWLITDSKLTFTKDQSEWTGTKIIFEISEINNKTQIHFTHKGLVRQFECYGDCSNAWTQLIQKSLFSLITKGVGMKVF